MMGSSLSDSQAGTQLAAGQAAWYSAGMHHLPADMGWQDRVLSERLAGLPFTKRREEARLGRWTAKSAIACALGLEPTPGQLREILITNASDGAPEAKIGDEPLDAVIAMTDRADWAVCAVMAGPGRIGCDLELVEPRSAAFVRDYFTPAEQRCVGASDEPDVAANLLWSAKESALKVLRTGLRRDTRSVEVSLGDEREDGWHSLAVQGVEGQHFPGWWLRCGSFLLTVVAEGPFSPPRSLQQPAPLHEATPGHSWLDNPYAPVAGGSNPGDR